MAKGGKIAKSVAVGAALAGGAYMAYKNKEKLGQVKDQAVDKIKGFKGTVTDEMDTNGDGQIDTVAIDTDGDGRPDTIVVDTDGNGKADTAYVDTTGDGVVDTTVDIPED